MARQSVYLEEGVRVALMKERLSHFSSYPRFCVFVEDLIKTHPLMEDYFGTEEVSKAKERIS